MARVLDTCSDRPLLSASLLVTLTTTLQGFLLAALGGVGLAVLFNQSRLIEYSLYPYAVILQVTPIVAIAPLLLVYLPQQAAVLACAWIVAFFPVLANTTLGLNSVDHNLVDLFRLYGATRRQVLFELKLPAALPYILGRFEDRRWVIAHRRRGRRDRGGFCRRRLGACLSHRRIRLSAQHPAHVRRAVAPLARRDPHFLRAVASLACHAAALARERDRARGVTAACPAAPPRLATGALSHAGYPPDVPAQEVVMAWLVIALVIFCAAPAQAQNYPTKPIHILSPYAPGGISDIASRILGAKLTEAWGQQVVVENRPGGNGFIAMTAAAKAAPDGYTYVMATVGDIAINPAIFKEMPYDVDRDLAPVAMVSDAPMVLAAHADAPFKSVAEVIAAAKAQPGRLSVATPGNGSVNQIVLEWMALNTGTRFQHIPYKGGAPAAAALAGGDIPLGVLASSSVAPHVKSGRIRVLAVTMAKRSRFNPEWPTLQETGVSEVDASNWTALFAPEGHSGAGHRQVQRRSRQNPRHARCQGALRRRRRGYHPFERGGVGRSRETGGGALPRHRPEGEYPAGLSRPSQGHRGG